MNAPSEAELVVRLSLRSLLPLFVISAALFAGCGGGGGGGSTPGGGGGGGTHTATPTPQPAGPALNAIAAIVPNGLPNASVTAPPIPSANFANGLSSGPFVYSAAGKVTYGTGSPPLTVTDNDASGATCLVYEAAGASSATPCPFAASTSSVTLTNANDGYAVLYNAKFLAGGALTISAPGFTSLTVSITPTAIAIGPSITFPGGKTPDGALVYESTSMKLFVAVSDPGNPLYAVPYSLTTGYGTPAAVPVQSVNGNPAVTALSGTGNSSGSIEGGAHDFAIDSQGNIWFTENNGHNSTQYVAVYVQHGSEVNPNGGTVTPTGGAYVEYTLLPSDGTATRTMASIAIVGNYVYAIDENGGFWRIDMTSGSVFPNLGTAYTGSPTFPANAASELTDATGANSFNSVKGYVRITNMIVLNGSLWMAEDGHGHLVQVTFDQTATPSAGVCMPAGPPTCIGAYQVSSSTESCPNGVFTDGTNLYVPDCIDSKLHEYSQTPPFSQSSSVTVFNGAVQGGLQQTLIDKWFWTAVSSGLAAVESMGSTTTGPATALNTACGNSNQNFRANGIIIGPDGTLLYSPASNNGATKAVVCGVVY